MLYFDHNSTTPVDSRVAAVADRANRETFGNPSSIHLAGQTARQALERSRRAIALALGAEPGEIVFTSGGTESNNLAIQGVLKPAMHAVTTAIEHPAVLEPLRQMARQGVEVTYLPVTASGVVAVEQVAAAIRPETALVSVMMANNETGAIQPVTEIGDVIRKRRASGQSLVFHSDGVQALGKIALRLVDLGVDLFSMSGHKLYSPKGMGVLYVRKGSKINPIHLGGRHERGFRAGTENVAGAVAFASALELCSPDEQVRLAELRDHFERELLRVFPDSLVNAASAPRIPNTSSVLFPDVSGEALLIALDMRGICVSTGSACSSGSIEPSHVLLSMGLTPKQARGCMRFSFGRGNTISDVNLLIEALAEVVSKLRKGVPEKQLV